MSDINTGGYESMVWVSDKDGKEYACYLKDVKIQYPCPKDMDL
mgnify:CR=1 FL=1